MDMVTSDMLPLDHPFWPRSLFRSVRLYLTVSDAPMDYLGYARREDFGPGTDALCRFRTLNMKK